MKNAYGLDTGKVGGKLRTNVLTDSILGAIRKRKQNKTKNVMGNIDYGQAGKSKP